MTSIRQLITDGFRESGILAVGVEPDAEEHEEGLRQIRRLLRSLFGHELGENLKSIGYGNSNFTNPYALAEDLSSDLASTYIPSNCRVIFNNTATAYLYLNPNPRDGARLGVVDSRGNFASFNVTLNGNGRLIESASTVILNINSLNREWFFRGDLGKWVRVTDPDADDESPFPSEFDDYLTTLLAFRLNPRYGAETDVNLAETLREMKKRFRARYAQSTEEIVDDALLFLPSTSRTWTTKYDFSRG